jgi:hypothetical protein
MISNEDRAALTAKKGLTDDAQASYEEAAEVRTSN